MALLLGLLMLCTLLIVGESLAFQLLLLFLFRIPFAGVR
jgi:hypothetical protein